jgi:hypothetical protein
MVVGRPTEAATSVAVGMEAVMEEATMLPASSAAEAGRLRQAAHRRRIPLAPSMTASGARSGMEQAQRIWLHATR